MKNELIKRATVGNYVKADTTGTNTNWEVGEITNADSKHIWFKSAVDGQEVKISRQHAFKATREEFEAAKFSVSHTASTRKKAAKSQLEKEDLSTESEDASEVESMLAESDETRSIVKKCYRSKYLNTYSANGNSSKNNGDPVAALLEGKTLEEAYEKAAEIGGIDATELAGRWDHLNPGQQRMLIGNHIRKNLRERGAM